MNRKSKYIILGLIGITIAGFSFKSISDSVLDTTDNGIKIKIFKEKLTLSKTEEIILKEWDSIDEFNSDGYYYLNEDIAYIILKDEEKIKNMKKLNSESGMVSNILIEKGKVSFEELEIAKQEIENALNDYDFEVYSIDYDFKNESIEVIAPGINSEEKADLQQAFKDLIKIVSKKDRSNRNTNKDDFLDIDKSHWAYDAIKYLQNQEIASGDSNNLFNPDNPITREDGMTLAYKAIGATSVYRSTPEMSKIFTDQNYISQYAERPLKYFESTNSLSGYPDGSIKPKENIKRAEAVTFLTKAFSYKLDKDASDIDLNFYDISSNDYYYNSIQKLKKAGAISDKGEFRPFEDITRAEYAYILYKICNE
ncbi:MAG: S-layer homology domain-containing protein [Andreesenia angusta]|nr:S-layer homology domain-containing protein [Andreesenia angusta]